MKVYVLMINDRHSEPEAQLFSTPEEAITEAKRFAHKYDTHGDYEETQIDGWLFYATYSCESDAVWVLEKDLAVIVHSPELLALEKERAIGMANERNAALAELNDLRLKYTDSIEQNLQLIQENNDLEIEITRLSDLYVEESRKATPEGYAELEDTNLRQAKLLISTEEGLKSILDKLKRGV